MSAHQAAQGRVFRVDKFVVPAGARQAFLHQVEQTHAVLRAQDGFIGEHLLERRTSESVAIVTIVIWSSGAAIRDAATAVKAPHEARQFAPAALFKRLGITPDIGTHSELAFQP